MFNTLLADKATDDRLRRYPHWLAERNLANEASDESVRALIEAVRGRYEIARRWYRLKAKLLGVERLADYDRMAAVTEDEVSFPFARAREIVLDCYASFSPELGGIVGRFFEEHRIDAPVRPAKRGGAFCASAVPSVQPYVLLNYTSRRRDVLTLAHELGHGVHFSLAARQGIFHQSTPLTLAETASVFGETIVFGRLLEEDSAPASRLALLAENLEDTIATVFRQVAMNHFEDLVHTARREQGELSVERFGELWAESQAEMLGDSVELTEGYRSWWSYIPHFIGSPGYVYAYAYGQLLALSVYRALRADGFGARASLPGAARGGRLAQPAGARGDRRHRPRRSGLLGGRVGPRRAPARGGRAGCAGFGARVGCPPMRIKAAADDSLERVAIAMNLVPLPAAYVLYGMTSGRVVGTAQRVGIFGHLLKGPATAGRLAEELSLQLAGTRLLCETLSGLGILEQDGHTFSMSKRSRKWLDPDSDTYIGTWVEHTVTYWEWYGDLERIVREGGSFEIHREPAEDEEYWRVYITGQLCRSHGCRPPKSPRRFGLGQNPTALLDVAGGHGWFSAELCRRHETLKATVLDLPGSARVGREIISRAGMSDRVEHREGDMFEADLARPL